MEALGFWKPSLMPRNFKPQGFPKTVVTCLKFHQQSSE